MSFSPFTSLYLEFRDRTVTVLRDHCPSHEVSCPCCRPYSCKCHCPANGGQTVDYASLWRAPHSGSRCIRVKYNTGNQGALGYSNLKRYVSSATLGSTNCCKSRNVDLLSSSPQEMAWSNHTRRSDGSRGERKSIRRLGIWR